MAEIKIKTRPRATVARRRVVVVAVVGRRVVAVVAVARRAELASGRGVACAANAA